jgi:hypothetical protein
MALIQGEAVNEVTTALEAAARDYRDRNASPGTCLEVILPWWVVGRYGGWESFCQQISESDMHPVTVKTTHPSGKVWVFRAEEDQWL